MVAVLNHLIKWLVVAAVLVTAPLSIPLLILGFVTEVVFIPGELRFRWRMRSLGRSLSQRKLLSRVKAHPGTLIVDAPTVGWAITRVWWTEDDVLALAPAMPPSEGEQRACAETSTWHPFDRWCWDRYLHPEHGLAVVVGVWHSQRMAQMIVQQNPSVRLVHCWSGAQAIEEMAHTDGPNAA